MLDLFKYPKNSIIQTFEIPITAGINTRFLLLPNQFLILHENQWIILDQLTLELVNQFRIRSFSFKSINFSMDQGVLAILENEPLIPVSPSVYKTRIAKLNTVDGSIEKYIDIVGLEEGEQLIDIAADSRYIYILLDLNNKKRIKQYDLSSKQMFLLTDNLNNQVKFNRMKIENDQIFLLDSLENDIYEVNKFNGRSVLFKRQFPVDSIVDFEIKFNNLFVISKNSNKLEQISLSPEFSHVSLQTNVFELATNGSNQSLIRGTVFNEVETFQPFQPLNVRILKPLDLITKYVNKDYVSFTTVNTRGDRFIPFLERTDDYLFMDPGAQWEFVFGDFETIEQIRIKFAQFRPGDIRVDLLTENGWEILESTPLPLLLTREDIVFDNFFEETKVNILGIRIVNLTSNTLALTKVLLLIEDPEISEKSITNFAADTGQTLFFVAAPDTTINEVLNPRFLQGQLYWKFQGRAELVNETLLTGDIGAFLHSTGENNIETFVQQKIILSQPVSRIITASVYVKKEIIFINNLFQNCGLQITLRDTQSNEVTYYQPFTIGTEGYKRVVLKVIPDFPVYDLDIKIICQKDTIGSIEIDKIQLEQDSLNDYVDHVMPNIFVKTIHQF